MTKFNPHLNRIREIRSLLLDFLNSTYPASLEEEMVITVMLELHDPIPEEYTRRDLAYLQGRGLLERLVEDHPARSHAKTVRWVLSAKGVSFVEHGKPWGELEDL